METDLPEVLEMARQLGVVGQRRWQEATPVEI